MLSLPTLKTLLAWDRSIDGKALIQAVASGQSPYFERALKKLSYYELVEICGFGNFWRLFFEKKDELRKRYPADGWLLETLKDLEAFYDLYRRYKQGR